MKKSAWMAQTNKRLTMFRRIFKPFAVETAEIAQLRRGQERRISRCSPRDRATGPSVTRANSEWKGNLEADSFHDPSSLESPVKYSNQTSSDNPTNILETYSNAGTQLSNLEFVEIVEQKERINRGRDINPEPLYLSRGSRFFRVDAKKKSPFRVQNPLYSGQSSRPTELGPAVWSTRAHPRERSHSLRSSLRSFFFRLPAEQIRATISIYNREAGKEGDIGDSSPDWLINIKMSVLVKATVYIYYELYIYTYREGGIIVSDCYSYSAGSHAAEHRYALLCWVNITSARGGLYACGVVVWTGVLPSQWHSFFFSSTLMQRTVAHGFKRLLTRGSVWNEKGESATYRATGLRDSSTWNRNHVLMRPAELSSKVVEIAGNFERAEWRPASAF